MQGVDPVSNIQSHPVQKICTIHRNFKRVGYVSLGCFFSLEIFFYRGAQPFFTGHTLISSPVTLLASLLKGRANWPYQSIETDTIIAWYLSRHSSNKLNTKSVNNDGCHSDHPVIRNDKICVAEFTIDSLTTQHDKT